MNVALLLFVTVVVQALATPNLHQCQDAEESSLVQAAFRKEVRQPPPASSVPFPSDMRVPAAPVDKTLASPVPPPAVPPPFNGDSDRATVVDLVVPGSDEAEQSVIRVQNPEAIEIRDVNVTNPVASFRSLSDWPEKSLAIHRVPMTIYSKLNANDQQLARNLTLQIRPFDAWNSSLQDYAHVARGALLEMIQAMQRAAPNCAEATTAKSELQKLKDYYGALYDKTDTLAKSLARVVNGTIEATALEVAKVAQKILENRGVWEEHAGRRLTLQRQEKEFLNRFANELLDAVRYGITSLRTCAMSSSIKLNLTEVTENFYEMFDLGTSFLDGDWQLVAELLRVQKGLNASIFDLTLSENLADELVQDASLKWNASQRLDALGDSKENLTKQLMDRVRLTENISHDTRLLTPMEEHGTKNLWMGTAGMVVSAAQAANAANQLQDIDHRLQEIYNETLQVDLHMKLKGVALEEALLKALAVCADGLRLARYAGVEVKEQVAEIFKDVHGIVHNNASSTLGMRAPGVLQSVKEDANAEAAESAEKLKTKSNGSAKMPVGNTTKSTNSSAKMDNKTKATNVSMLATKQDPGDPLGEADAVKEVPWTEPSSDTAATTTLLFGTEQDPPAEMSIG